jgi:hypothetical protein
MLFLIDSFSLPPILGTYDPDAVLPIGEANRQDPITYPANAVLSSFGMTMADILSDDTVKITKRILRQSEWDTGAEPVRPVIIWTLKGH